MGYSASANVWFSGYLQYYVECGMHESRGEIFLEMHNFFRDEAISFTFWQMLQYSMRTKKPFQTAVSTVKTGF